jgi:hypothetical protein
MTQGSDYYDECYDGWTKPAVYQHIQARLKDISDKLCTQLKELIKDDQEQNGWSLRSEIE